MGTFVFAPDAIGSTTSPGFRLMMKLEQISVVSDAGGISDTRVVLVLVLFVRVFGRRGVDKCDGMWLNRGMEATTTLRKGDKITVNGRKVRVRYVSKLSDRITEIGYWPADIDGNCRKWEIAR